MSKAEKLLVNGYKPKEKPDEALIKALAKIDHEHYGDFGADTGYFREKFKKDNIRILVVEEDQKPTGFCVIEIMNPGQKLDDFCNLSIELPQEKWMHIIAFTTKTDFMDKQADGVLLSAAEKTAHKLGCNIFCVPLSVDHPYKEAYPFFMGNGYQQSGTIDWIADDQTLIPCNFLIKQFSSER